MSKNSFKLYYFILSGSYYSLAEGELDALLEINNIVVDKETSLTQLRLVSTTTDSNYVKEVVKRAGAVNEGGVIIGIYDIHAQSSILEKIISNIMSYFDGEKPSECWLNIRSIRGFNKKYLGKLANKIASSVCRKTRYRSSIKISLVATDGILIVGIPLAELDTKEFMRRRPSTRPFFRSIAMSPQLSRILVNLSRLRKGEYFLDPFSGTGSILIEAFLVGGKPIGIDIDWDIVKGSRMNLKYYGMLGADVLLSDAKRLSLRKVHAIATDPPYGRSASTHGEDIYSIYRCFIRRAAEVLEEKRYMVFMAPIWLEKYIDKLLCKEEFILKRKYYIYVHSALTRIVYEAIRL